MKAVVNWPRQRTSPPPPPLGAPDKSHIHTRQTDRQTARLTDVLWGTGRCQELAFRLENTKRGIGRKKVKSCQSLTGNNPRTRISCKHGKGTRLLRPA